jgi:hypothetical protein
MQGRGTRNSLSHYTNGGAGGCCRHTHTHTHTHINTHTHTLAAAGDTCTRTHKHTRWRLEATDVHTTLPHLLSTESSFSCTSLSDLVRDSSQAPSVGDLRMREVVQVALVWC